MPLTDKDGNRMVLISQPKLDELIEKAKMLDRLERAGVDNWGGYEIAMQEDD